MLWMTVLSQEELPTGDQLMPQPDPEVLWRFYAALGMNLAAWQFVENAIGSVYLRATGGQEVPVLGALAMTANFRTKLQMTEEAVAHSTFSEERKAEWKKLTARIAQKSQRRNKVAHGSVMFDPKLKGAKSIFIASHIGNPAKATLEPGTTISLPELEEMTGRFAELREQVAKFWFSVLGIAAET